MKLYKFLFVFFIFLSAFPAADKAVVYASECTPEQTVCDKEKCPDTGCKACRKDGSRYDCVSSSWCNWCNGSAGNICIEGEASCINGNAYSCFKDSAANKNFLAFSGTCEFAICNVDTDWKCEGGTVHRCQKNREGKTYWLNSLNSCTFATCTPGQVKCEEGNAFYCNKGISSSAWWSGYNRGSCEKADCAVNEVRCENGMIKICYKDTFTNNNFWDKWTIPCSFTGYPEAPSDGSGSQMVTIGGMAKAYPGLNPLPQMSFVVTNTTSGQKIKVTTGQDGKWLLNSSGSDYHLDLKAGDKFDINFVSRQDNGIAGCFNDPQAELPSDRSDSYVNQTAGASPTVDGTVRNCGTDCNFMYTFAPTPAPPKNLSCGALSDGRIACSWDRPTTLPWRYVLRINKGEKYNGDVSAAICEDHGVAKDKTAYIVGDSGSGYYSDGSGCDGIITEADYDRWKCEYLGCKGELSGGIILPVSSFHSADFDGSSGVDLLDFETWRRGKFDYPLPTWTPPPQ